MIAALSARIQALQDVVFAYISTVEEKEVVKSVYEAMERGYAGQIESFLQQLPPAHSRLAESVLKENGIFPVS